MQENTTFEKSLCESARLFSISKKNLDLFLLLQTSTITYQQLFLTGLHGATEASGRLSLKRLENEGYITGRQISSQSQSKYFILTPKGKLFIKEILPEFYTEHLQINWGRRPPGGSQQILHRIRSNDFYFAYISHGESVPLPWVLEKQLPGNFHPVDTLPRCDGFLQTNNMQYYVEQDNSTQSETVLSKKIVQYCNAGIFDTSSNSLLVFCLAFPHRNRSKQKPAFSLYKITLKFSKLWALLEEKYGIPLDCQQFLQSLRTSDLIQTVTPRELSAFENIMRLHPGIESLADISAVKRAYLNDAGDSQRHLEELDTEYQKRLKSHFSGLYSDAPAVLYLRAMSGFPLFAVPNHRLPRYLPYIMQAELNFKASLFQCLFYSGLNTDGWKYHCPLQIRSGQGAAFFFRLGLSHETFGYIAVENLSIDLSSRVRLRHFLKNFTGNTQLILLIADHLSLKEFLTQNNDVFASSAARETIFLFIDDNTFSSATTPPSIHLIEHGSIGAPVFLECDAFDEKIHILRKEPGYEPDTI